MSLEAILADLQTRAEKKMYAPNKRAIARGIASLRGHEISGEDAYALDDVRAALGYRAITNRTTDKSFYANLATTLEANTAAHNPYDDSSRTATTILTSSPLTYETRFNEVTAHLESGLHYTDALLCREHLRNDSYVRRRSRTHEEFSAQRDHMLAELDEYIDACRYEMNRSQESERWTRTKKWGMRAAAACWGAVMTYSALPAGWL